MFFYLYSKIMQSSIAKRDVIFINWVEYKFSEECWVYVSRCWMVVSKLNRCLRWKDNWSWVYVMNISVYGKQRIVTKHRLVYATWSGLEYKWEFKVGYLDWDYENCCFENLYVIGEKRKESEFDRVTAFKLLEMYHRWMLFDSEWKKVVIDKPKKRVFTWRKVCDNSDFEEVRIRNGW